MTLRRFYTERTKLRPGSSVQLLDDEAKHVRFSVRMRAGDEIILFNGEKEYLAKLKKVTRDVVLAEIISEHQTEIAETKADLTLFLALTKPTSFELVIQKATELGINRIIPVATEYSQVKIDYITPGRLNRWQKIALQACKQSERVDIPLITSPVKFEELATWSDYYQQLVCLHPHDRHDTKTTPLLDFEFKTGEHNALLVGPEGGFSPFELENLAEWNIKLAHINPYILRSETAAIVGVGLDRKSVV